MKIDVFVIAHFTFLQLCVFCILPTKQDALGRKIDQKSRISGGVQIPKFPGRVFPNFSRFFQIFWKFWTIFPNFPDLVSRQTCFRHKKHHLGARTRHVTQFPPGGFSQKFRNKVLYHVSPKVGVRPVKSPRKRTV